MMPAGSDVQGPRAAGRAQAGARYARSIPVLIVSDRPWDFESVAQDLRTQMFDVTLADNGWHAYYRVQATLPSVVLIDADMSHMDSFTICRLLQRTPVLARVRVMLASRRADSRMRVKALETGAVDCLSIPFLSEELMLRIATHLRATPAPACAAPSELQHPAATCGSNLVRAAMELIDAAHESADSVKTLARRVGANERRLASLFKSQVGVGLGKYMMRKKMEMACRLLKDTSMPIQEVAVHVGFRSPCNFSVAFQQQMGISPSRFRQGGPA